MTSELRTRTSSWKPPPSDYSESGVLWETLGDVRPSCLFRDRMEHSDAAHPQSDRKYLPKQHTSTLSTLQPSGVVAGISKVFSATIKLSLMAVFSKLTKLIKSNILTYCVRPKVLEPVDITLVPLDAAKHVEDSFRVEVETYLRVHGHDVIWVPSGAGLTILLHQPEQRVNPSAVLDAVSAYERAGSPVLVVFLLPHNPGLSSLPPAARDMTDDKSFRKLERSVRGCTDWYFWHMCSSRSQEERLKAFNMPAADLILSQIRSAHPDALPSHTVSQQYPNQQVAARDRFNTPYNPTEHDSLLHSTRRPNTRSGSGSQGIRRQLEQGWGPA